MLLQFIFIFGASILILGMLFLFIIKAGLQLQYIRLSNKQKPGSVTDIIQFDWSNSRQRQERWQAFLLFPLMFAVTLEDDEDEVLLNIKKKLKKIHIAIYIILILLIILGIYSEKVFPQNAAS